METITPINEEYIFKGNVMISQTDINGIINYANRMFCKVSGYRVSELLSQPHNIVKHPDMPTAVFTKMWETIRGGQAWNGLIKNLRKDGTYYWVDTEILPIKDKDSKVTGYISVKKPASRKDIQENKAIYQKMLEAQS